MERELRRCRLFLVQGDLTDEETDAIVNAANSSLLGGSGVDGAIHKKGGPAILEACRAERARLGAPLPPGEAVITTGGALSARFVIHAVGPRYGIDPEPGALLARAYQRALELAGENRLKSLAFPSISTGAYRFPIAQAARIALRTIIATLDEEASSLREIKMVLYNEEALRHYEEALEEILPSGS